MGQGLALLDEAMDLARQEKSALEQGEYDAAIEMAERRGALANMAWDALEQGEREPYRKKLAELLDFQGQLAALAAKARDAVRSRMNRSKLEKRRMNAYSMAVGQALQ